MAEYYLVDGHLNKEQITKVVAKIIQFYQVTGVVLRSKNPTTNRWDASVGIGRNLSVGFDPLLLLISGFNKLVPGANFRGRSNRR
jgi:hypothetical protein